MNRASGAGATTGLVVETLADGSEAAWGAVETSGDGAPALASERTQGAPGRSGA
jgi:hypothetical protein